MREGDALSEVKLDVGLGHDPRARDEARRIDERYFRVAVCGDFGARAGGVSGAGRSPAHWRVDRDEFDEVLASIAPILRLDLGSGVIVDVRIRELDDFHPDRLFERILQLAQLRALRERLADPSTFQRAAAELAPAPRPTAPPPAASTPISPGNRPSGSLLDAIVGSDPESSSTRAGHESDDLHAFIQRVMAPHLVARADPRQGELLAQLDASITMVMRALLHHPAFQAAEALWRGVHRLVRSVDTDARLQIHLFDVTREELTSDLLGNAAARETMIHRRLAEHAGTEDAGWGVLVAHYAFRATNDDVATLARLADVGRTLDAPWIAEAHPDLATGALDGELRAAWERLRNSDDAQHLALALPRILLRLPYGQESEPIESFAFEELETLGAHESYLWGNPALACAALLAQGFTEREGGLAAGRSSLIEDVQLHVTRRDGESVAKPCAEVLLTEDDAQALLESGFIAMLSYRDQGAVRVSRIQSVAEPPTPLAGRLAR